MNKKIVTVTANPAIDRVYFVDEFKIGEVHRPIKSVFSAGGKGINVSRVCNSLSAKVVATGFVGGYTGDFIKNEVQKIGIDARFTEIQGETRICVNISDKNGKSSELLESGPMISEEEKNQFLKDFENNIDGCDIIAVSGSLPRGLSSDFYAQICHISKKYNKKIIFDTSGKTLEDVIATKPYMVKPNEYEFLKLTGQENFEPKNALAFLKQAGVEVPFISLGKEGAVAMIEEKCYKFFVPAVKAVNTVGSGDSTVAGIITGLSAGMSVLDSIKLGMAAGVTNALFESTGCVSKELVEKHYKEITVSQL